MRDFFFNFFLRGNIDNYNKLTKKELQKILSDYGNVVITKRGDHSILSPNLFGQISKANTKGYLITHIYYLNAALCIQYYLNLKFAKYKIINEECPITQLKAKHPIRLFFKDKTIPFSYFVCTYELEELAKYFLSTGNFRDIITQLPLYGLQIKKIDYAISGKSLFIPSLFNLYHSKDRKLIIDETQQLLLGLERMMNDDVETLYNYICGEVQLTQHVIKTICKSILKKVNIIDKIDPNYGMCVKSDIKEHFNKIHQVENRRLKVFEYLHLHS